MTDQDSKSENNQRRFDPELLKKGLRCDLDQYEMLKRCSDKKDMTEWNQRYGNNSKIWLEGVYLDENAYLKGANLGRCHLKDAKLILTHLEGAWLSKAHLEGANLSGSHLENTDFVSGYLEGANFDMTYLHGAKFNFVFVNSNTSFIGCRIGRETDFRNVSLDTVRIKQETKQLLEYNIRRMNWEKWYEGESYERRKRVIRKLMTFPVRLFWWMSDYGRSTGRIIFTFFGLAVVFAFVYWLWPGCVVVNSEPGNIQGFWYALYFSVVTPFGLGNIAANPDSPLGQTLLMLQVILGYVLLGALVTRFAVLFTAGGPAGEFADEKTIWERLKEWWKKSRKEDERKL